MTQPNPKTRWRLPVTAAAALFVATAACSGSSSKAGGKTSTTTQAASTVTTATTTAKPAVEGEVLAAYRSFWGAYLAAADPMNPEDPRLTERATNGELETVQKAFLARRSAGEVIRGTLDLAPRVASKKPDGTAATVTDCYADRTGVYDAASGSRKDTESGVRHLITVEMVLQGAWKVSSVTLERDGCAPAA